MLISHSWLKKYLPGIDAVGPDKLSEGLTQALAEVESYRFIARELQGVVVGEIREVNPVEGKDHLHLCLVDIGNGTSEIICGAPNVRPGLKVAVCLVGGVVYDPTKTDGTTVTITAKALGGKTSQGMICSVRELGIGTEHSEIMELEADAVIGTNIVPELQDIIYEIENKSISHRPDCFSHKGIAREISAIFKLDFMDRATDFPLIPTGKLPFTVENKVTAEDCPRFSAIVLNDIKITTSPLWLQSKLYAVGMRPINNVVDITNYVMLDRGQPLHAYDYDKLDDHKLVVRTAKPNEKVTTLDSKEYTLQNDMLVIADNKTVQDIAGIMGAADTEISIKTTKVVLEAANFNMYSIRGTSRKLGIRSEASTRFEKGLDPNLTIEALKSAVAFLVDMAHAEIAGELVDQYNKVRAEKDLDLDLSSITRFLGIDISKQAIIEHLTSLQLELKDDEKIPAGLNSNLQQNQKIRVVIPTFRSDLNIENDLLEEIARLYGYSNLNPTLPKRDLQAAVSNPISMLHRQLSKSLTQNGMDEILTYSFVGKDLYEKLKLDINQCLEISNPISPDQSHMRNTLVPSLISKVEANAKKYDEFAYFEIARTVKQDKDSDGIHVQPRRVAGLTYNKSGSEVGFYKLSGILENLFANLGIEPQLVAAGDSNLLSKFAHKGRAADINLNGKSLGFMAQVHPQIMLDLKLDGQINYFELDFDLIQETIANLNETKQYKAISPFQSVSRDLSFWVDAKYSYAEMVSEIKSLNQELIKAINLQDVFQKEGDKDKKSITLNLVLQSPSKTLDDKDITQVTTQVIGVLTTKFKIEIRK